MVQGQPLHPLKHVLQIFRDTSNEKHGPFFANRLHINYLELKVVFLALKEFQELCLNNIVLIAADNTVVA